MTPGIGEKSRLKSRLSYEILEGLHYSLHCYHNAEKRWEMRRRTGLTDAELKQAIREEYHLSGGCSRPGYKPVAFKGGENPCFYFDVYSGYKIKPTLSGQDLINAVRIVFGISEPVKPGSQLSLFTLQKQIHD